MRIPLSILKQFFSLDSGGKVKLNIFSRLIVGYLTLLILVTGVSIYTVTQLSRAGHTAHSIISRDNYLIDIQKKLAGALLSEIRYEEKFLIMKDPELHKSFLQATGDFEQNLGTATSLADSTEVRDLLAGIKQLHENYQMLFNQEVAHLKTSKRASRRQYAKEKGKIIDAMMADLETMKELGEKNVFAKIKKLDEAGARSSRAAFVMLVISLSLGIIFAIYITRSITVPLSRMKKKTADIASGIFEDDLNFPSPPEIGELASAFNLMCKKLKEVEKMKSDFFSLMSHELRTPLTSIKEGTNLLQEGSAGETTGKQKRLLAIIAEESNRLIELVNSLLDLSKMEAGVLTYDFAMTDLAPLVKKAIVEVLPIAESKKVKLEIHIEELPLIIMDREKILQVLRNLLGNALKFTPNGGSIIVKAGPVQEGVKVSVADSGPGIPEEHLNKIFDKFRQMEQSGAKKLKGTGLGLAIARHIIDKHGGRIWIESIVGKGSTFFFILPD